MKTVVNRKSLKDAPVSHRPAPLFVKSSIYLNVTGPLRERVPVERPGETVERRGRVQAQTRRQQRVFVRDDHHAVRARPRRVARGGRALVGRVVTVTRRAGRAVQVLFNRERVRQFLAPSIPLQAIDRGLRLRSARLAGGRRVYRVLHALGTARPQVHGRFDGRRQVVRRAPVQYFPHCTKKHEKSPTGADRPAEVFS